MKPVAARALSARSIHAAGAPVSVGRAGIIVTKVAVCRPPVKSPIDVYKRQEHGRKDDQKEPHDFLGRIFLARGAFVDHPDPKEQADEFQSARAFEEIGQRQNHVG